MQYKEKPISANSYTHLPFFLQQEAWAFENVKKKTFSNAHVALCCGPCKKSPVRSKATTP
jgi:hypothetical protein